MTWPIHFTPSPYQRLLVSTAFSRLAGSAELVILNWWVLTVTGDPAMIGVVTAARLVPLVVSAPLSGVLADRVNPCLLVTIMCATSGALTAALAVAVAGSISIWLICALLVVRGLVTAAEPAMRQIAVTRMVAEHHARGERTAGTVRAMSDLSTISSLCLVTGPLLSGVFLATMGAGGGLGVLAVFQIIAAGLAVGACPGVARRLPKATRRASRARRLRPDSTLAAQIILALGPMLAVFPYTSMIPVIVAANSGPGAAGHQLPNPTTVAVASAAAAVGAVATTLILRRRARNIRNVSRSALVAAAVCSPALGICAFALRLPGSIVVLCLALALLGAVGQFYRTTNRAAVALLAPENKAGTALSISSMDRVLIPLGSLACGLIAAQWGATGMLASMAVANLVLLLPALALLRYGTPPVHQ